MRLVGLPGGRMESDAERYIRAHAMPTPEQFRRFQRAQLGLEVVTMGVLLGGGGFAVWALVNDQWVASVWAVVSLCLALLLRTYSKLLRDVLAQADNMADFIRNLR